MKSPLVSVIINCYNSEKYLRETIDSLIAQTYENWEAIFWDNCSTDKTAEIVASYNEPRFRYFLAEKNTPLGEARNLAMQNILGEYLCFLDSDDLWELSFLSEGIKILQNNVGVISGYYTNYIEWKTSSKTVYSQTIKSGIKDLKSLINEYNIGMSACIMSSGIVKSNKLLFDAKLSLVEDYDLFVRLSAIKPLYYDDRAQMLYRIHDESASKSNWDKWYLEFHYLYNKFVDLYVDSSILNKEDLIALKRKEIKNYIYNCENKNLRFEALKAAFMNRHLFSTSWMIKRLIFPIVGRKMYLKLRQTK